MAPSPNEYDADATDPNQPPSAVAVKPNHLPLNVIIVTDHDLVPSDAEVTTASCDSTADDANPDRVPPPNRTKKFYESDDTFIQTIFSQTITSTTVTPTDDDCSTYSFQQATLVVDPNQDQEQDTVNRPPSSRGSSSPPSVDITNEEEDDDIEDDTDDIDLVEEADARSNNGQMLLLVAPALTPTNDLSQHTDIMDGYAETMISFTDVLGLDRDPDDHGGGGGGGRFEEGNDQAEEEDGGREIEMNGSVSYFDRTIVDDEEEDVEEDPIPESVSDLRAPEEDVEEAEEETEEEEEDSTVSS